MSDGNTAEVRWRMRGGPWDGTLSFVAPSEVGEMASFPRRGEIDGRWYSVEHLYALHDTGELIYVISQYEFKS